MLAESHAPGLQDLGGWFKTYGRPKPQPEGLTSTFASSAKVYGGTEHHSAFRSMAATMKRGRCIR